MLLLSLGSETLVALLCDGEGARRAGPFAGPDLAWLLFGPDMPDAKSVNEAADTAAAGAENVRIGAAG